MFSGADGFTAIASYGNGKQAWLETFFELPQVDSKSNGITAVPLLLKLLNLNGAAISLDAMETQWQVAVQIK